MRILKDVTSAKDVTSQSPHTLLLVTSCVYAPVLHLLVPVVCSWQLLVETVVRGVAGRVVNDGGVSVNVTGNTEV